MDLKPSTRLRVVALDFDFPAAEPEAAIVAHESGIDLPTARGLVQLGARLRQLRDRGLAEVPSTRLLVATARLIAGGIATPEACQVALLAPLTDDPELLAGMRDLVSASLA
jgi:nitric oxide reductase NorQ protein